MGQGMIWKIATRAAGAVQLISASFDTAAGELLPLPYTFSYDWKLTPPLLIPLASQPRQHLPTPQENPSSAFQVSEIWQTHSTPSKWRPSRWRSSRTG